ncbi:hypothetical protein AB3K78_00860 [Leucobacter sp. HNU]|uniref:hypothetical protein n=1 Tax=Leucobacter sp. HNU TaxID=3236805 RepID=UPI003A7F9487
MRLGTADYDAEPVTGTLFSDPVVLGSPTVSDGSIELTIPANAEIRAHKLAITSDTGVLIGWAPITVETTVDGGATAGADGSSAAGGATAGADGTGTSAAGGATAGAEGTGANGTAGSDGSGLPTTGGAALTPILIAGGAVILLGAIVLAFAAARRRRNAESGTDGGEDAS